MDGNFFTTGTKVQKINYPAIPPRPAPLPPPHNSAASARPDKAPAAATPGS